MPLYTDGRPNHENISKMARAGIAIANQVKTPFLRPFAAKVNENFRGAKGRVGDYTP